MNVWTKFLGLKQEHTDVVYSKVVDKTDFRFKDTESRISRLSEKDTGMYKGAFDYSDPNEAFTTKDPVTGLEVDLRQGLINRGEVENIRRSLRERGVQESLTAQELREQAKLNKQQKARNDALDEKLGVNVE